MERPAPRGALALALLIALAPDAGCTRAAEAPAPDGLRITNARLLGEPELQDLWIAGGRVAAVGGDAARADGEAARVLDAAGGLVLPGFHDAHVHALSGGESLAGLSLEGARSLAEVAAAVRERASSHPAAAPDDWILGRGWSYDLVPAGSLPDRHALDAAAADRPVALESYDGHALWLNGVALERAGIDAGTPDPPDGVVVREAGSRVPSGVLLDGAGALLAGAIPAPSREERLRRLEAALAHCLSLGITSLDDFAGGPDAFDLYAELEARGRLPLRVRVSLPLGTDPDAFAALGRRHRSERLAAGYLKGFVDGVIEAKTAFLLDDYAGSPGERGRPLVAPERLLAQVRAAHERGVPVALHAIGDAAVRLSLDTFERVQRERPRPGLHHRIEHIELVAGADLPRFAALGVVASMQPFHANPFGDAPEQGVWSANVGAARMPWTFAWRSLRAHGAPLVFGSDWPVLSADPLQGLAVALTRRDARGRPAAGWNAQESLDLVEALSAFAGFERAGALPRGGGGHVAAGAPADLVILSPAVDPARPESLWRGARVRHVLVAGAVAFSSSAR